MLTTFTLTIVENASTMQPPAAMSSALSLVAVPTRMEFVIRTSELSVASTNDADVPFPRIELWAMSAVDEIVAVKEPTLPVV